MSLDAQMIEVRALFFAECREGLDVLEVGLLGLDEKADRERIDTIFRAAHSIKGGAGTFGFNDIAAFTNGIETLLDEMRRGRRGVAASTVQTLLDACDCLRGMVSATEGGTPIDRARADALTAAMNGSVDPAESRARAENPVSAETGTGSGWRVRFAPVPDLLKVRNEPTRMFAELAKLGTLHVEADSAALPALENIDPHLCHLAWTLTLRGAVPRQVIEEIFDWVDPACELTFTALSETAPRAAAGDAREVTPAAAPDAAERAVPAAAARPSVRPARPAQVRAVETASVRVATDKIDGIIDLVGELLITQSMLSRFADESASAGLRQSLLQLARNTRELQESIMTIRMLPVSSAFNRFPRVVHDVAAKLGKKVELHMVGESTELDKTVLEKIIDPLVHLIRNALDHGLESPEVRRAAGKSEVGRVQLAAFHEGGSVIIEVRDDGAGLDRAKILEKARAQGLLKDAQPLSEEQIFNLVFLPGFSTAAAVSDLSGRGVGMDVVRRNIADLGGQVQLSSTKGAGSVVRIRLPLTLAILEGQLVRVGSETYVIPLLSIVETIQASGDRLKTMGTTDEVVRLRDEFLPVAKLCDLFGVEPHSRRTQDGLLVVVESDGRRVGLLVDELMAQQQVVIKSLETNFHPVDGVMGATILGDGQVALILDVPGLISLAAEAARNSAGTRAA